MEKISYGKQSISQDDIDEVVKALKSPMITQGEYIDAFENALKEYTGAKYTVALSSGTAALHTAYFCLDLQENSQVITSPITFVATSNAALYLNASVKFTDINLDNFLIDEDKIEENINSGTKIITPIHYAGLTCDMEKISRLAQKYNLRIVEDACHALGGEYKGKKVGACEFSDIAVFSFHPVKHITTAEGGALLTNDYEIYKKALAFRNHGIVRNKEYFKNKPSSPTYHEMQFLGYNYRMSDIQAALGLSQMKKLSGFIKRRQEIADIYYNEFKDNGKIIMQKKYSERMHAYHLFPILFENGDIRDKVYYYLKENNIWTQIHYMPVNMHPYYEKLGHSYKDTPIAYEFYKRELSLPIYPLLKDNQVAFVIDKINDILRRFSRRGI